MQRLFIVFKIINQWPQVTPNTKGTISLLQTKNVDRDLSTLEEEVGLPGYSFPEGKMGLISMALRWKSIETEKGA